jgi:nitronate monooxygenase
MYIVSTPALVIAQCRAGIIGCFPSLNARPQPQLEPWIEEIRAALATQQAAKPQLPVAPFGVNLIVNRSNRRLEHDTEVCIRLKVPLVITSLQAPGEIVGAVHGYGGLVFHDVTTLRHAEKAAEHGVDGLILVSAGAGGHAGTLSPFALLPEVRRIFPGTIVLAGAMSTGRAVLAAQAMGADLAYMGTRFIATVEANAHEAYKQMIVDSAAKHIVYTPHFTGVSGSYLAPSIERAGIELSSLSGTAAGGSYRDSDSKPAAWRDIWSAGQGVGSIDDVPTVGELVGRLTQEYRQAASELWTRTRPWAGPAMMSQSKGAEIGRPGGDSPGTLTRPKA